MSIVPFEQARQRLRDSGIAMGQQWRHKESQEVHYVVGVCVLEASMFPGVCHCTTSALVDANGTFPLPFVCTLEDFLERFDPFEAQATA